MNHYFAANRFGYGVSNSQRIDLQQPVKDWLMAQLRSDISAELDQSLPNSEHISLLLAQQRKNKRKAKQKATNTERQSQSSQAGDKDQRNVHRQIYLRYCCDSINAILRSKNDFAWRVLDFFSNHFSVSAQGNVMTALAPTLEREAILPNLTGRFEDMLLAVEQHPAMLIYLNNEKSFGPNSSLGRKNKSYNENLAREVLELHTLGVNGGYTQRDVQELALGITGWSVANPLKEKRAGFLFRDKGHEPGERALLGKSYRTAGQEQGIAMLSALANHPSTVKHLCFKLARHFCSDTPSAKLITSLEKSWHKGNGHIPTMLETLLNEQEAMLLTRKKYKSGREYVLSTLRVLGLQRLEARRAVELLAQHGQQPFKSGSPKGYGDTMADWHGPASMLTKLEWANVISKRYRGNINELTKRVFVSSDSKQHVALVSGAESKQQAVALALLSPEFLKR